MNYVGLDIHQKHIQVSQMNAEGVVCLEKRITTDPDNLLSVLDGLDGPLTVSMEAGRNHWWINELLSSLEYVESVEVVDPRRSRNFAKELSVHKGYGRAKNDRIDAQMLGEISRLGLSPSIHLPNAEQLVQRSLCRRRLRLMQHYSSTSARIQALLSMHGLRLSTGKLLSGNYHEELETLPSYACFIIGQHIDEIRLIQVHIEKCEEYLDELLPAKDGRLQLLMSIPGIGIVLSRTIASEILSISYFAAPKYLVSYSGLAPVEYESDGKKGKIKLNKHCNYYLKYAFVLAAHCARKDSKFRSKYDRDVKKHNKSRAKINLARRLAKTVFWVLTRQQSFQ